MFILMYRCVVTSSGGLRQPSIAAGFGHAINIETLVAAAERRDIQIEVGLLSLGLCLKRCRTLSISYCILNRNVIH